MVYKINASFNKFHLHHKSRICFDEESTSETEKSIRLHNSFAAFFLKLLQVFKCNKIFDIQSPQGKVYHLNRKSLNRWIENNSKQNRDKSLSQLTSSEIGALIQSIINNKKKEPLRPEPPDRVASNPSPSEEEEKSEEKSSSEEKSLSESPLLDTQEQTTTVSMAKEPQRPIHPTAQAIIHKINLINSNSDSPDERWLDTGEISFIQTRYLEPQLPNIDLLTGVDHNDLREHWSSSSTHLPPHIQKSVFQRTPKGAILTLASQYQSDPHAPRFLALPVNHYRAYQTLILVDCETRTLEYYDSHLKDFGADSPVYFLNDIAHEVNKNVEPGKEYQVISKITTQLQKDSSRCSFWVIFFTEMRIKYPDFDFNALEPNATDVIVKYMTTLATQLSTMT